MRYAIGIDLGTTNCALAYIPLEGAAESAVLSLEQWSEPGQRAVQATLPSFLYNPSDHEKAGLAMPAGSSENWVPGRVARRQAGRTPGRVVHSAKSWLAQHERDATARILPWQSSVLAESEKISPLDASAALLRALRVAWEDAFPHSPLAAQQVTVTVPASFDMAAQQATLEAASRAGFGNQVRLLEEPQAAFYRALECGGGQVEGVCEGQHILVVDVGGGTSDFSLFSVTAAGASGRQPGLERVAVSEHILLGGDNIDLALAHMIEGQLLPDGSALEGDPWHHLLARARELKEEALKTLGADPLPVAIPGRGAGLFDGSLSTVVDPALVREVVLEGFFPPCGRDERPQEGRSALQEWGLPYAADFAVTRYLAAFLRELPRVDAILFNGGTLAPPSLRERICAQVAAWQGGGRVGVLANPEWDLAVARGAAAFGRALAGNGQRIEAGAARGLFLEVEAMEGPRRLLCVLPRGAPAEREFSIEVPGLEVKLNQRVQFRVWQGIHRMAMPAGDWVDWNPDDFSALPALETTLRQPDATVESLPVTLSSRLSELGLLQIRLVGGDAIPEADAQLAFNLRGREETPPPGGSAVREERNASAAGSQAEDVEAALMAASETFSTLFAPPRTERRAALSPKAVLEKLERLSRKERRFWSLSSLRKLSDALLAQSDLRESSPEHLETWLHLIGWCLRPGFGEAEDTQRIARLWSLAGPGALQPNRRTEPAFCLLWRRLAGGLSAAQQSELMGGRRAAWLEGKRPLAEGVLLAGTLERLPLGERETLVEVFLNRAVTEVENAGHPAPYLVALTGLLSRTPLGGRAVEILAPIWVERAWEALCKLEWTAAGMSPVVPLFLRAARRLDGPGAINSRLSRRIADRLARLGVSETRLAPLRAVIPLTTAEIEGLFEEGLPVGLMLKSD